MKWADEVIACRLNGANAKQVAIVNVRRRKGTEYQEGEKVWKLRPPKSVNKLVSHGFDKP